MIILTTGLGKSAIQELLIRLQEMVRLVIQVMVAQAISASLSLGLVSGITGSFWKHNFCR